MRSAIMLVLVLLAAQTAGCAALRELFRDPDDRIARQSEPDPLYEELVDHYVDLAQVLRDNPGYADLLGGT